MCFSNPRSSTRIPRSFRRCCLLTHYTISSSNNASPSGYENVPEHQLSRVAWTISLQTRRPSARVLQQRLTATSLVNLILPPTKRKWRPKEKAETKLQSFNLTRPNANRSRAILWSSVCMCATAEWLFDSQSVDRDRELKTFNRNRAAVHFGDRYTRIGWRRRVFEPLLSRPHNWFLSLLC